MIRKSLLLVLSALLVAGVAVAQQKSAKKPAAKPAKTAKAPAKAVKADNVPAAWEGMTADIPYEEFTLSNGLRVIVHEDRKAPIVAVNVWYHVGSKNEKPGKTGFAHLFEHLMFNGSENMDDDYFQVMERIGATDLNGTTNNDRTNYFQNVPTHALDVALWMESDRMGHLLGAVTQAKLDEQRGVVQNEKRQGDNNPYSIGWELTTKATWPAGHPYSWTVIGSLEDLNNAKLEDVHEWFKTYYGAANAVIVLAGDIDVKTARTKMEKYFGHIPSGPPVAAFDSWVAKRSGEQRQVAQDRVKQTRITMTWNVPAWRTQEATVLDIATDVLSAGKNSRLYKRLVYDDQIATQAFAYIDQREIASQVTIGAMVKPGIDVARVEKALREELTRFLTDGPTVEELDRAKTESIAGFIRGIERIGGFGGKSDILAQNAIYAGRPDFYKTRYQWIREITPEQMKKVSVDWLSDGAYVQTINPFPEFTNADSSAVSRKSLPVAGTPVEPKFPAFQSTTLPMGLKVYLIERKSIPTVQIDLMLDAGYASDQGIKAGTNRLAMDMLDEGTATRTSLQISEQLQKIGATVGTGSDLDASYVSLDALKANLDPALEIFADVILNPAFPAADFDRIKKQTLVGIQQEKTRPVQMALRTFPALLYGKGHAYSNPLTGSGTEASVGSLTRDDLKAYHAAWFKANAATMIVVGDITMSELKLKLEKLFGGWRSGDTPKKNLSEVKLPAKQSLYIIDKPGSPQSVIMAGHLVMPKNNPDEIAIESFNNVLGGSFTSRINMNLREDKHWSYGASSFMRDAKGQRPFIAYANVQTDKTAESMAEIRKEFNDILSTRPVNAGELEKIQKSMILELPGAWETNASVQGYLTDLLKFGYPEDYYTTYPGKIRDLNLEKLAEAGKKLLRPDQVIWVIVGDRAKIEEKIKALGYGELKYLDADGNEVK